MIGPISDPHAPYARVAVVALISRHWPGSAKRVAWLLLENGSTGHWDPPGGRLERSEDLATGVRREVEEETGLKVFAAGPCYAYLTYHKGERLLSVTMACAPLSDPDSVRLDSREAIALRWAHADDWMGLAQAAKSSWTASDIRLATALAGTLLRMAAAGPGSRC